MDRAPTGGVLAVVEPDIIAGYDTAMEWAQLPSSGEQQQQQQSATAAVPTPGTNAPSYELGSSVTQSQDLRHIITGLHTSPAGPASTQTDATPRGMIAGLLARAPKPKPAEPGAIAARHSARANRQAQRLRRHIALLQSSGKPISPELASQAADLGLDVEELLAGPAAWEQQELPSQQVHRALASLQDAEPVPELPGSVARTLHAARAQAGQIAEFESRKPPLGWRWPERHAGTVPDGMVDPRSAARLAARRVVPSIPDDVAVSDASTVLQALTLGGVPCIGPTGQCRVVDGQHADTALLAPDDSAAARALKYGIQSAAWEYTGDQQSDAMSYTVCDGGSEGYRARVSVLACLPGYCICYALCVCDDR